MPNKKVKLPDNDQKRTEINELGEFGLIKRLTKGFSLKNTSSIKGVGDDAAVIYNGNKSTIVTTDLLIENIHFDLVYMPLKHLGYKAVIVNLSDVYAMNAEPKQITISIAVSNRFSVEALDEFYEGVKLACDKYDVDLVGGDTSSALQGMIISVTAIGEAKEKEVVYRDTAKKGDLVCVTGDLGGAYVGLQLLEREKQVFLENPKIKPDLEGQDYIISKFLKPEARKDVIRFFKEQKIIPTSMIDISDGLSSDILHICQQSNAGCKLYEEKFPIDSNMYNMALKFNIDPTLCVLSGGEDYELLFTIKQSDLGKVKNDPDITVIGEITKKQEGTKLVTKSGNVHDLISQGWNMFKEDN